MPAIDPVSDRLVTSGKSQRLGNNPGGTVAKKQAPDISKMTREQLFAGVKWLSNQLYNPENFGTRVVQSIERLGPQLGPFRTDRSSGAPSTRPVEAEALNLMKKLDSKTPTKTVFQE